MRYLKQYGLERSGTNYMRALIEKNLDVRVLSNVGGHKHSKITCETNHKRVETDLGAYDILLIDSKLKDGKIPKLFVLKDPFHWVVSYARYRKAEISDGFVEDEMKRYIEMNTHWFNFCDYMLYYEEMIECPIVILSQIANAFDLKYITNELFIPRGIMQRGGDFPAFNYISDIPFNGEYYYKKKYMLALTDRQISYIESLKPEMKFYREN